MVAGAVPEVKIVGIMLVRDEDRFVERALRNVTEFCDDVIVCDHGSRDGTPAILARLVVEFGSKLRVHRVKSPAESHALIQPFAGEAAWIFGVDGDEIYDPAGLARLRSRLEAGEFDRWWVVFGNVLNVTALSEETAAGYLAPPCRSMTKLFNFAAIDVWDGPCMERLHGGTIRFRPGFHAGLRCSLQDSTSWEEGDFRCLHLCFLSRSSLDAPGAAPRRNIMDRHAWTVGKVVDRLRAWVTGRPADWKQEKYARGPVVTKSVGTFFRESN